METSVNSTESRPRFLQLRNVVSLFVLFAAAGCAVGTLVGFAARQGYPWELACHFRAQYCWVLALCAAAFWFCGRRWLALVSAALAAVNLMLIAPLYLGPAPPTDGRPTARALSQNVYWLNTDPAPLLALIREEKPDFLVLMEVTPRWAEQLKALGAEYPHSRTVAHHDPSGIAFYSRVPIKKLKLRGLGDTDLPTVVAELEMPDGLLTVICTHTASPGSRRNFEYRNLMLADLAKLVRTVSGPVMVLGDLNATSWSPNFSDMLADSGLRDTRRGFGVQGTWPGMPWPLRIPIDHCLVSPEIAVFARRVGPSIDSDHRAVIIDFSIGPR